MIICKFTHDSSILCDGTRFWVLGPSRGTDNWYYLRGDSGDIVGATNLDDGRVHIATAHGSVYQVDARPDFFVIQQVKI